MQVSGMTLEDEALQDEALADFSGNNSSAESSKKSRVQVEKRDGRVVDFDPMNIIMAIKAAFKDLRKDVGPQEEQMIRDITDHIEAEIQDRYNGPAKIEDIQTLSLIHI